MNTKPFRWPAIASAVKNASGFALLPPLSPLELEKIDAATGG